MDEGGGGSGRKQLEKREMSPGGDHRYVFFDHSHNSITAFCPKEALLGNLESVMRRAVDALERARAGGGATTVVQALDDDLSTVTDQEEEVKSDAESIRQAAAAAAVAVADDDDESCAAALKGKRVRRKLKMLAQMVGVDSGEPGVVLGEVVRVLRDLERDASQI